MNDIFPKGAAWIDGKFVKLSEAKIPILDWGFLRSDATYDVVHVWKGRFFQLDKHIDRFFNSTKKLRMPCKIKRDDLKKILAGCVKNAGLDDAYVEMIQTRGMSPNFVRDSRAATPRVMAFAVPFGWILKPEDFEIGLDVLLTNIKRIPPSSVDPTINTPDYGVLEGITRQTVINLAKELKIKVNFKPINAEMLKSSDELFATSTPGGVMPITKVDGKLIDLGKVGNITRKIHKIYWDKHILTIIGQNQLRIF